MYQVNESKATAIRGMSIAQTIAEILQQNLQQMNQSWNIAFNSFLQQQKLLQQSDVGMATHLHDGDNAGIQVLVSQAV
jgi:hypothetical protein